MEYEPDLDDDNLMQAMSECQESIARGDQCTMCEAMWHHHNLIHNRACLYVIVSDKLEARDVIETYLDAS